MAKRTIAPVALCCAAFFTLSGAAYAECVKVSKANLRQGPGTSYAKSWEVYEFMPLKKVGEKGDWHQVEDVDGDKHWVHAKLVSDGMSCAVVKGDKTNVRTGPGTSYAKSPLSPVEKYYSFKVVETKGSWVKVHDEVFNEGWIAKSLLWMQ